MHHQIRDQNIGQQERAELGISESAPNNRGSECLLGYTEDPKVARSAQERRWRLSRQKCAVGK